MTGYPLAHEVAVAQAKSATQAKTGGQASAQRTPAGGKPDPAGPAPPSAGSGTPPTEPPGASHRRKPKVTATTAPVTSQPAPSTSAPVAAVASVSLPTLGPALRPVVPERSQRRPAASGGRGADGTSPSRARAAAARSSARERPRGLRNASVVSQPDRPARPSGRGSGESTSGGGEGSPVTRTVRDIVEVVPGPIKAAFAALMMLSAVLFGGYVFTALRARRLARQRADLLQDLGLLQTALLPAVPETVGAVRTSVAYRPSDGPGAGGDFYDALLLPGGRAAFILGDVCGHGRQALARTAFMRYTLRAYLEAGLEPRLALQLAGPVIDEHLGGNFATVVLAVHDPRGGSLTYACAGHPAPIVVGPTRPEPVLSASSPPIGLGLRTGLRQTTVPLPPSSVACLYTDGLAEARTATGILGRPRLADILQELGRGATAAGLIDRVAEEARLVTDDMATVVLSPTAGVTVGGFREECLELDLHEAHDGLGDRFLEGCGVKQAGRDRAVTQARAVAAEHGAAVLHVRFGTRTPTVDVLPRNVESLAGASLSRASA
ncbi:MAG: SpoIIE family protein phosphatase [Thermoleophilaceae bacterium]